MRLSHSKLSQILSCPMSYYLCHEAGIWKKVTKPALAIGSAVHWGIEHNTEDLSPYYKENGTFKQGDNYTPEQQLAEAMVHGYLSRRKDIFEEMLTDPETGEELEMLDETHEVFLEGRLPNASNPYEDHKFVGIIDLLVTTDKGFILVDYKTSSLEPDWDGYLDQLYRYIFELRSNFPDVPVLKIAIINIRKSGIRQRKNETEFEFRQRLRAEYDIRAHELVNYHEFLPSDLNEQHINEYIENLKVMCDMAETIKTNELYFINYAAAKGTYGKSEYWDIFYRTKGAEALYNIRDYVWSEDEGKFVNFRDCVEIDMQLVEYAAKHKADMIMNKYDRYVDLREQHLDKDDDAFHEFVSKFYLVDKKLLALYALTYRKEKEVNESASEQQQSVE